MAGVCHAECPWFHGMRMLSLIDLSILPANRTDVTHSVCSAHVRRYAYVGDRLDDCVIAAAGVVGRCYGYLKSNGTSPPQLSRWWYLLQIWQTGMHVRLPPPRPPRPPPIANRRINGAPASGRAEQTPALLGMGQANEWFIAEVTTWRPLNDGPRYDEAGYALIESLTRDTFAGRPHWGKNQDATFNATLQRFPQKYGENWSKFWRVQSELDPTGVFISPFIRSFALP